MTEPTVTYYHSGAGWVVELDGQVFAEEVDLELALSVAWARWVALHQETEVEA